MSTAPKAPDAAQRARPAQRQTRLPARSSTTSSESRLSSHWRTYFLTALVETSNVTRAAAAAGVSPSHAYRVRMEEPAFRDQWLIALAEGYRNLEMEVLGYLRDPAPGHKLDVANAVRVLTLHRQTMASQRAQEDDMSEQEVLDSINAMIDEMRDRASANSALLATPEPDHAGD